MKARTRDLLARCIEDGLAYGWNRAFKHDDSPGEDHIKEQIDQAIWNEIDTWFNFQDEREE